jgi:hypothetical protein
VISIPAYVVGTRTGVASPGIAFVPFLGPYIVLLESIRRSGWLCLLSLVPLVSLVFVIWLAFTIPAAHGRTQLWGIAFLIPVINLFAFYAYAFSLDQYRRPGSSVGYHVPPGGDWRR